MEKICVPSSKMFNVFLSKNLANLLKQCNHCLFLFSDNGGLPSNAAEHKQLWKKDFPVKSLLCWRYCLW